VAIVFRAWVPVAAMALLLGACAGDPDAEPPRTDASPPIAAAEEAPAPVPPEESSPSLALIPSKPGGTGDFVPPPVPSPASLKGMSQAEVTLALGKPDFTRKERTARLWQYNGRRCALDLFLYPQKDGSMRVTHVDVRTRKPFNLDGQACLDEIVELRRGPGLVKG
jgi:hypothetical protein